MSTKEERREKLEATVDDLVSNLLYYDRKEDEELGVGDIEGMILEGEVTVDEIVEWFAGPLRTSLAKKDKKS